MALMSQRAMNNVVIFAMLIMIALFNIDKFLPVESPSVLRPLLPENAHVLKVEQGESQLVRSGRGWRQITVDGEMEVTPEEQITAWREGMLSSTGEPIGITGEPLVTVVWLAGQSDGQVYAFYPVEGVTYVRVENTWYELSNTTLTSLLPWYQ
ncbi:hypothetical protein [Aestuariibacter sp. A3R04]|uniref:hypothetical protein n=1 Tax=Aestuariibacter sp. A3R04 TaxID=2841571 RepID=UPI001C080C53|nr:hypothetical protein [Aestuariibacter sp. A3R04]MBU3023855.1 hypothetical protein [Aestuariibacter sp. A3R04]